MHITRRAHDTGGALPCAHLSPIACDPGI